MITISKNIYRKVLYFYWKHLISDKKLIKRRFRKKLNRELDLKNPIYFNDKLQWLKLYWKNDLAQKCADKFLVRDYVKEKIGDSYLNELINIYDSVNEINIDKLPSKFVLKCNHGSGFNIICKNKEKFNLKAAKKIISKWLKTNYYYRTREWVYKNINPRILCEKFLIENGQTLLTDYKFFCFNGVPKYCQVIRGRGNNETIDFYDMNWNLMPFNGLRKLPKSNVRYEKIDKYEEMQLLATKLSKPFPFVRVDFYYVNNKIYFGELTFFPMSGYGIFTPSEWELKFGELLKLP